MTYVFKGYQAGRNLRLAIIDLWANFPTLSLRRIPTIIAFLQLSIASGNFDKGGILILHWNVVKYILKIYNLNSKFHI